MRELCLHLPGATERLSHGAPAFFAGKQFVMLWPDGHHDHGFPHLWCAAPAGARAELTGTGPERFFRPPYVGGRGWIGVRLDGDVRWDEVRPGARRPTEPLRPGGWWRSSTPAAEKTVESGDDPLLAVRGRWRPCPRTDKGAAAAPRLTCRFAVPGVGLDGVEPSTSALSVLRSNQLSYSPGELATLASHGGRDLTPGWCAPAPLRGR